MATQRLSCQGIKPPGPTGLCRCCLVSPLFQAWWKGGNRSGHWLHSCTSFHFLTGRVVQAQQNQVTGLSTARSRVSGLKSFSGLDTQSFRGWCGNTVAPQFTPKKPSGTLGEDRIGQLARNQSNTTISKRIKDNNRSLRIEVKTVTLGINRIPTEEINYFISKLGPSTLAFCHPQ